MKKCPYCAEEIQDAAIVCRFCQRQITDQAVAPDAASGGQTVAPVINAERAARKAAADAAYAAMQTPEARAAATRKTVSIVLAIAAILVVVMVGGAIVSPPSSRPPRPSTVAAGAAAADPPPRSAPAPAPIEQPLALLSMTDEISDGGGYAIVTGEVQNISGQSLKNVAAVATWYDKDGGFIRSDDTLIEYNPILPGQKSPYKVMSTYNPAMAKYAIAFKSLFGAGIASRDDRKAAR